MAKSILKEVDESLINLKNFINDADVKKRGSTAVLSTLFYYLDDILSGHPDNDRAWEQFSNSEKILKLPSLQTKGSKAKPPVQVQKWLGKIYDTRKQWISLPSKKIQKYISELESVISNQSITQQQLLSHIGRIRYMASIYLRNLEV